MFSLADIQAAVPNASVLNVGHTSIFQAASIDSRTIHAGELFFALLGQRDGHSFIAGALGAGAAGIVISHMDALTPPSDKVTVIRVSDTLVALKALANYIRRKYTPTVVAITGSAGKTTTKDLTAHVLETSFHTHRSAKSLNNQYGVPLTILGLEPKTSHLVLEIGTNHPGEIAELGSLSEPDVAVLTNIGYAHIEHFGSLEGTLAAKTEILKTVKPGGSVILNGDDPRLRSKVDEIRSLGLRLVMVGAATYNDIRFVDVEYAAQGSVGRIVTHEWEAPFSVALVGDHFLYAALLATAAAVDVGVAPEVAVSALASFAPPQGRLQVKRIGPRLTALDDTYNASPDAVLAAVRTLRLFGAPIKIVALGEMKELGVWREECHRIVGREVGNTATHLIAIGDEGASVVAQAALSSGMRPENVYLVKAATEAIHIVLDILGKESDDVLLLAKGSRFTHVERVLLGIGGTVVTCKLGVCTKYIQCKDCPELTAVRGVVP